MQLDLIVKTWDEWHNKWIITKGAGTPCFFGMLNTVFVWFKNVFKPVLIVFHCARNVMILQLLFLNCDWWYELTFMFSVV